MAEKSCFASPRLMIFVDTPCEPCGKNQHVYNTRTTWKSIIHWQSVLGVFVSIWTGLGPESC